MKNQLFNLRIKILFFLFLAFNLVSLHQANAQKIKKNKLSFSYTGNASNPLPSYIKTYMIDFKGDYKTNATVKADARKRLKFEGYEEVGDKAKADLLIELYIHKMSAIKPVKKQRAEKEDDKTITKYWYEFKYKMPISVKLILNKYNYTYYDAYLYGKEQTVKTSESNNPDFYVLHGTEQKKLERICFKNSFEKLSAKLSQYHKLNKTNFSIVLFSAKAKKNKYPELKLAAQQSKSLLKAGINKKLTADVKAQMQDNISTWESAVEKADLIDKKAEINKEIYFGLLNNLVFAYVLTNDYDKAWAYYQELKENLGINSSIKDAFKELTRLFTIYQNDYIFNNKNYKIGKILAGNWKVVSMKTEKKYDLNKDGVASNDLLKEYEKCKKYNEYRFFATKKLTTVTGSKKDGCKPQVDDELFWSIRPHKAEGRRYLFVGDEANFDPRDAKSLKIVRIWYGGMVLNTDIYKNDDYISTDISLIRLK